MATQSPTADETYASIEQRRVITSLPLLLHDGKVVSEQSVSAVLSALQAHKVALVTFTDERRKILEKYSADIRSNDSAYSSHASMYLHGFKSDTDAGIREAVSKAKLILEAAQESVRTETEEMTKIGDNLVKRFYDDNEQLKRLDALLETAGRRMDGTASDLAEFPTIQQVFRESADSAINALGKAKASWQANASKRQVAELSETREALSVHGTSVSNSTTNVTLNLERPVTIRLAGKKHGAWIADKDKEKIGLSINSVKIFKAMKEGEEHDIEIDGIDYTFTMDWARESLSVRTTKASILRKAGEDLNLVFADLEKMLASRRQRRDEELLRLSNEAIGRMQMISADKNAALVEVQSALNESWKTLLQAITGYKNITTEINGGLKQSEAQGKPITADTAKSRLEAGVQSLMASFEMVSPSKLGEETPKTQLEEVMSVNVPSLIVKLPLDDEDTAKRVADARQETMLSLEQLRNATHIHLSEVVQKIKDAYRGKTSPSTPMGQPEAEPIREVEWSEDDLSWADVASSSSPPATELKQAARRGDSPATVPAPTPQTTPTANAKVVSAK